MCHIMDLRFSTLGSSGFSSVKNVASRSFLVGKISHELGEKPKQKYSRKHPFSDSFREVLQSSFEKRYGFLRRFSNENVRSWPDSAAVDTNVMFCLKNIAKQALVPCMVPLEIELTISGLHWRYCYHSGTSVFQYELN